MPAGSSRTPRCDNCCMSGKSIYDMDENELVTLITKQKHLIAKLSHERLGSPEYRFVSGILKDAEHLLDEKRKKPKTA